MLELVLHRLVTAFGYYDGFGEAVLGAAAVGVDEELDEAESAFECGGAIAEGSLDGVPEGDVSMHEGDDADLHKALAGGAAFATPEENAEVKNRHQNIEEDLHGFASFRVLVHVVGRHFGWPVHRNVDLIIADFRGCDHVRDVFHRLALPVQIGKDACRDCDGEGAEDDGDDDPVDQEGEGPLPEGGEFDAVEFEEPLGFAGGEVAHRESVK